MIQASRLVIYAPSGPITPVSPGKFIEGVGKVKHALIEAATDDTQFFTGVEVGAFSDDTSPLKFRQCRLKLKEIYDVELLSSREVENRPYIDMAVTHFGMTELNKFSKKIKPFMKIEGDMTVDLIHDLAIEFMKEMGSDAKLILLKNSVLIATEEDFTLQLAEVYKQHKKSRMMCGALFCSRPHRVVKADFTGKLVLR